MHPPEPSLSDPIYVTRPFLPPLSEFLPMLERIWESRILTNHGPFHLELEARLQDYFGVSHVSLMANGMLALEAAIEAAGVEGEVITTPYSFVATAHAVKMERLTPVFVDIRCSDLNIDTSAIEAAITPRTSAIVAVHCYGNPCDIDAIERIAKRHNLKVIFDAAHAFGVRRRARSILGHGNFSILSFHATKAFNTFEGGAVISSREEEKRAIDSLRNFGIASEVSIPAVGTNAKMNEFSAALGLLQLEHFEDIRRRRGSVDALYRELLADVTGIECLAIPGDVEPNYSYFPVLVTPEYRISRDELYERLREHNIYARRYFYPLLSNLPMYQILPSAARSRLPVANAAAEQVLCLPIYPDLAESDQLRIIEIIRAGN